MAMTILKRIKHQRLRLVKKKDAREGKNTRGRTKGSDLPCMRIGNQDFGCPFHGKDRFSSQWKKFAERSYREQREDGAIVTVLLPYQNNKYEGSY